MRILVTGFEAFGKDKINPTSLLVETLPKKILHAEVDGLILPVVSDEAMPLFQKQLAKQYDGIILLGVARGRSRIALERVAINVDDYRIPDNAGVSKIDEIIEPLGPAAYFSTLPLREMERVLKAHQIPAYVSNTAGTYLCNHMMYEACHLHANTKVKCGFIHVPAIPEMVLEEDVASMPLETLQKALVLVIQTLILSFYEKVAVSACLCGRNCKYNGGNNLNASLMTLLASHQIIEVCPECSGGMPTPRIPSEQKGDKVINSQGEDVTAFFKTGAQLELNKCLEAQVDLAILQARSPSCGIDQVYDGTFTKTLIQGDGVFVKKLKAHHIECVSSEDCK